MKREIKFRGKRSKDDKWVYGGLVYRLPKHPGIIINEYITHQNGKCEDNFVFYQDIYEDTVGQFTGLYDKNGKEIYEGDILTAEYYPFMKDGKMNYIAVVEWFDYDACWYASMQLHRDSKARGISVDMPAWFDKDTAEIYEVIGNIHDNPELIKEQQQ